MNNDIMIIPTGQLTAKHRQLYLNADPDQRLVRQYLPRCSPFELRVNDQLVGVILLEPLDKQTVEIKNLSIDPQFQHHGYGTSLVQFAKRYARLHSASTLVVGTGSTSMNPFSYTKSAAFASLALIATFSSVIISCRCTSMASACGTWCA